MTSCGKTYYQVINVESTNVQKESNNYVFNDGVCKITYNFWKEGGDAGFSIENLSDDVIYVDLANTFFIVNGWAYDYYKARKYGLGKTTGKSWSKSLGKSTGLSVSASAYGIWRGLTLNGYLGSISAQASSVTSSQVSSSFFETSSSNLEYAEKPIVAIPPHASKSIFEYTIMGDIIQDCSVRLKVKKKQPEGKTYVEAESPIKFSNYVTYKMASDIETSKVITNDFYIGGFTNYLSKDIMKTEKYGCKNSVVKYTNDKYSPDCFYVEYYWTHSRYYSADAIGTSKSSSKGSSYYTVRKE